MTNAGMFLPDAGTSHHEHYHDQLHTSALSSSTHQNEVELSTLPPLPSPSPTDLHSLFFGPTSKSHARRQNPGHVPRPRNAFILFRCDFVHQRVPSDVISDHRDLSRLAGYMWRQMTDEQKMPWFEKAEAEKRYHSQMFPTYRYTPGPLNRPKRVYRRKKPPPAQEITLENPHSDIWRRAVSCPAEPEHVPQASSVAGQGSSVAQYRVQDFRSNCVTPYQPHPPSKLIEMDRHTYVDVGQPRAYQLGPFCAGFLQIPREEDVSSWESPPSDSSPLYEHGPWHPSTESQTHSPTWPYPYTEGSPIETDARTQNSGSDGLYNMWMNLEAFHNQFPQRGADDMAPGYDPRGFSHAESTSHGESHPHPSESSLDGVYSNRFMNLDHT